MKSEVAEKNGRYVDESKVVVEADLVDKVKQSEVEVIDIV